MAAVIVKPDLPREKFPWVEQQGQVWVAERKQLVAVMLSDEC